ncbi:hypothetical protein PR202_ga25292 [Eleusine coracana subsp. coracana]|uniref:Carboxypeptidase n=1 Tax=Eleusine coracana subsp. coracana TaxID=191504 RepID=A0AAV5DB13_ELECO|nr:hypothetical protein PR202_ga25292 [Eleusine coracana subsp. coracana]
MGPTCQWRTLLGLLLIATAGASAASPEDFLRLPSSAPRQLAPRFPRSDAVDLIRALNLHPADASSRGGRLAGAGDAAGTLVERPLGLASMAGSGGPSVEDLGHRAGYYRLPNTYDARMFYFFFESRGHKKEDPVVIWLTGGPGCSSELALFYENGPFNIADNLSLVWNDFGWDQASNLIYVDQPTGTGFSYSSNARDTRHNEASISNDLYAFLQAFFTEHPQYAENDFYITGESYAGHYIPAFASRVYQGNKNNEGIHINLKYYDIRKPCVGSLCYDFSNLEKFLNLKSVRENLGVGNIEFVSCSPTVYEAMLLDWMRNLEVGIPELLENDIKVLIYAGEYDLICNWLGNSRWVNSMEWSGKEAFVSSSEKPFTVDGKEAGVLKSHGPLSFLKVHDAGHMVPMDQPKAALEMLKKWTSGNLSEPYSSFQKLDFTM